MRAVFFAPLAAAPMLLAACTIEAGPEEVVTTPAPASCNAAAYEQFVGQHSPQITVPAGTEIRHYRSGDPVTMDFNPDRLNFEYDRSGRLVRVKCG